MRTMLRFICHPGRRAFLAAVCMTVVSLCLTLLPAGFRHTAMADVVARPMVDGGGYLTVGLLSDGTAVVAGCKTIEEPLDCDVSSWTDIVQVSGGFSHAVGLRSDGTVVAAGEAMAGQCDVSSWTGIQQVSAGASHTLGLRSDGTAVATGVNNDGQCSVSGWADLVQVSGGLVHSVGLRSDGTAVAVGAATQWDFGQCSVSGWTDIVEVAAGTYHTVGLKSDGTVVAAGYDDDGQCDVSGWTDIVQVSAGRWHTVGLKSDGTVVAAGSNGSGQCNVTGWTDIVQVSAGTGHTLGLKSDGSVLAVGHNSYGQCEVTGWNLGASYSATIWGWDYIDGWISVPIRLDGALTGYSTPHTFRVLSGTHTFTVPVTDPAGHPFSDWSTDWTDETITVDSAGTYTARYREGYSVTIWAWDSTYGWLSEPVAMDGAATGYSTPHTFTDLAGTHTFSVPATNALGDYFYEWDTGLTSTTMTVTSSGLHTARYKMGESPIVYTQPADGVGDTGATLNGELTNPGSAPLVQVSFLWGLTPSYGQETPPQETPAPGPFSAVIAGLAPNTTYHFRAKAVGSGTALGEDMTFTTAAPSQPWDINQDTKVDYKDLAILGAHYGQTAPPPYPAWDINQDGKADYKDLAMLGAHYGEGY